MRFLDGFQDGFLVLELFTVKFDGGQVDGAEHKINRGRVRACGFQRLFHQRFFAGVGLVGLDLLFVSVEIGLYLGRIAAGLFQRFHALLEFIAFLRDGGKAFRALLRLFDFVLQPGDGFAVRGDDLFNFVLLDAEGL